MSQYKIQLKPTLKKASKIQDIDPKKKIIRKLKNNHLQMQEIKLNFLLRLLSSSQQV